MKLNPRPWISTAERLPRNGETVEVLWQQVVELCGQPAPPTETLDFCRGEWIRDLQFGCEVVPAVPPYWRPLPDRALVQLDLQGRFCDTHGIVRPYLGESDVVDGDQVRVFLDGDALLIETRCDTLGRPWGEDGIYRVPIQGLRRIAESEAGQ